MFAYLGNIERSFARQGGTDAGKTLKGKERSYNEDRRIRVVLLLSVVLLFPNSQYLL